MKKITLTTTALYLALASSAMAGSNSFSITQAATGSAAPTTNFAQGGTGDIAVINQSGNSTITGVQTGNGSVFNASQENPTGGAANSINYTGRGNSSVLVTQRAANGNLTASGAAGNVANIDISNAPTTSPANSLALDQIGFNNTATIYDSFGGVSGTPSLHEHLEIAQYSPSAASGNNVQFLNNGGGAITNLYLLQEGGNLSEVTVNGGVQDVNINQFNTANNAAVGNSINLTLNGGNISWTQNGTGNQLGANLSGNGTNLGIYGYQNGNNNSATITQTSVFQDATVGQNILEQMGNNNVASATQTNTINSMFSIIQNGTSNFAQVAQSGNNNIALVSQASNANFASVTQTGNGSHVTIAQ